MSMFFEIPPHSLRYLIANPEFLKGRVSEAKKNFLHFAFRFIYVGPRWYCRGWRKLHFSSHPRKYRGPKNGRIGRGRGAAREANE